VEHAGGAKNAFGHLEDYNKGIMMTPEDHLALTKYLSMEDLMQFRYDFDHEQAYEEISKYPRDTWPRYNPRKPIERYSLDLTQLPGGNDNVSSLNEYNQTAGVKLNNHDFTQPTEIYHNLPTIKGILEPFRPWLGRTHIIRIDAGGFFPPHYDTVIPDEDVYDVRLVAAIHNITDMYFKWLYDTDNRVIPLQNGNVWAINTGKPHSVFSFKNDAMILVANLRFDKALFKEIIDNHYKYS
jgi:hypothetical protein